MEQLQILLEFIFNFLFVCYQPTGGYILEGSNKVEIYWEIGDVCVRATGQSKDQLLDLFVETLFILTADYDVMPS